MRILINGNGCQQWLPEDSPHGRFATKKIRHTTGEIYKCDREFESKRRTNVCNSADVDDSPRNDDRLGRGGWEGWVKGFEVGVEGLGSGVWSRGFQGRGGNPPTQPLPDLNPLTPTSNPLTQPSHPYQHSSFNAERPIKKL